jgi:hypothetical protein
MAKFEIWVFVCALALVGGCASKQPGSRSTEAPVAAGGEQRLSAETDAPALFLGPEPDAPVVGFLGKDVPVEVAGPSQAGRVPVRVRGALWTRGFVPEQLLILRTQRQGRLRGTPVYLGPNDPVNVLGPGEKEGRLRVRAVPKVAGREVGAYEGTYPAVGLAAHAAANGEALARGETYLLPANTALPLYDKPNGTKLGELPADATPLTLRVLSSVGSWFAVRAGTGPYLVGYTDAPLTKGGTELLAPEPRIEKSTALPRRLASQAGELKRVAAGARVSFGDKVIARLHDAGVARVLTAYPSGEVDALVAVNDEVTVRGLLKASDLSPYASP